MTSALVGDRPGRLSPWAIAAAILLPPLGVWLSEGLNRNFWIALVLTVLAFIPGILFALLVVLKPGLLPTGR